MPDQPVHHVEQKTPRVAFVALGPVPGTIGSILERLRVEFPEFEVDHVDIGMWAKSRRILVVTNLLVVLAERGPLIFFDRQRLWGAFYRTSFMFKAIRHLMERRHIAGDYAFSLQRHSLFDASVPGVPHFVYTDHTELVRQRYPDYDCRTAPPDRWLRRERQIYERARTVFTMSDHVRVSLLEQYGLSSERVKCVGAGSNVVIDDSTFTVPEYASKQILFVGRDWERKGGPDLVAAFRRVRKQIPDAALVIAGCSPDVGGSGITVLGDQLPAQLSLLFSQSAVFCMPTRVEPFGIAFVEAALHGLPVVGTSVGAVPDLVHDGKSGYLHAPHDVDGLVASLVQLMSDPELCRRMGHHGRKYVQKRFTWTNAVAQMAREIRPAVLTLTPVPRVTEPSSRTSS